MGDSNLLPGKYPSVLEIGCGNGATLHWLKTIGKCSKTYGIELLEDAKDENKSRP